ncbi:MAG: thioredoxin domain-containing protein [Proteobacteria bacterium]|nr:thioredoxin domain-containing protein [Pseudomonadota bacterium]MBU1611790.1 thioredoxin domain-containing protein [Pseudomonadota bacterium]
MKKMKIFVLFVMVVILASGCASRDYIKKTVQEDPKLMMEILHENRFALLDLIQATVEEEQALEKMNAQKTFLEAPLTPVIQDGRLIEGDVNAPITIVEYSDFLCPYCVRGHKTMNALLAKYPGKIRVVYKHNPLKNGSLGLSVLYEAAVMTYPDKAAKLKDLLFDRQKEVYDVHGQGAVVGEIIKAAGLDLAEMQKAVGNKVVMERVKADMDELASFELQGTPMYVVAGVPVRGAVPLEDFEDTIALVEQARAKK